MQIPWNSGSGRALLLIPDAVNAETPILCFLHGIGQSADNRRRGDPGPVPRQLDVVGNNQSPPRRWRAGDPRFTRFIIVCPQLESRRAWDPIVHAPAVRQLIAVGLAAGLPADIARGFPVRDILGIPNAAGRRKLLTGFSAGGAGVFDFADESLASENEDFWTALWSVAPANGGTVPVGQFPPPPRSDWPVVLHYGDGDLRVPPPPGQPPWLQANTPDRIYNVLPVGPTNAHGQTCADLYGAFPVKEFVFGFCRFFVRSGKPFFVPSPAIRFPGARGRCQGTEMLAQLSGLPLSVACVSQRLDA